MRTSRVVDGAGWKGLVHELHKNAGNAESLESQLDFGSMALAAIGQGDGVVVDQSGEVAVELSLAPGEKRVLRFVLAWHLPNLHPAHKCGKRQRHYIKNFPDAAVVSYFTKNQERLTNETRNWVATWNDSTLPQWLLDRSILTSNTLQTQNCLVFEDGRFWAWEGVGCCPGTCGHVWQYAYFNEFMTGFEYQAAAHMVAERDPDLVENGLAITRSIHDRYSHHRGRNPYNEIECSDHYARAGSSFGVFLAACGFHFDQELGLLRFDPVIGSDTFKAPFLASEGWGTFELKNDLARLTLKHGTLRLNRLEIRSRTLTTLSLNGKPIKLPGIQLKAGDTLQER